MTHNLFVAVLALLICSQLGCFRQVLNKVSETKASSPTPSPAKHATTIKAVAEASAKALAEKDFLTVADFTYGRLVTLVGGRDETVAMIEKEMKQLEKAGMTVLSVTVGEPQEVKKISNELFSIVPTKIKMRYQTTMLEAESFLIAVSEDNGKTWKLVDGAIAQDKPLLRELFPDATDELQLPPKKDPVFYETK
jgi:hypothetical protein